MKGQLIATVFIILLASSVIVGFIFYNWFYGAKYQSQVFDIHTVDSVRNLIETVKNYLRLSLVYSSKQATREHGCLGGITGCEMQEQSRACPWINNGPNPVTVDKSKSCLETYTKYYLNVYFTMFNTSLPVKLYKSNFSECIYDISESEVLSGKYDEGDFWVNCSGGKIAVSGKTINEYEAMNMSEFITKDRYWYLFRNFYDWANDDVFSPCICAALGCSCGSSSGEEKCSNCLSEVKSCAQKALDDLQRRFDEYVKCEMNMDCCVQGIGPPCGDPPGCQGWAEGCPGPTEHKCNEPPPPQKLCPLKNAAISSFGFSSSDAFYSTTTCPGGGNVASSEDVCHYEGRLAGEYTFKCIDYKYYVPSENGPVPLTFMATAIGTWRDPWRCCTPCDIPCGC